MTPYFWWDSECVTGHCGEPDHQVREDSDPQNAARESYGKELASCNNKVSNKKVNLIRNVNIFQEFLNVYTIPEKSYNFLV